VSFSWNPWHFAMSPASFLFWTSNLCEFLSRLFFI